MVQIIVTLILIIIVLPISYVVAPFILKALFKYNNYDIAAKREQKKGISQTENETIHTERIY